jgi:hypothetical protein
MLLFDLFERSRPRHAPQPHSRRVRCAVELLEPRLALSTTDPTASAPPPPVVLPLPPPPALVWTATINISVVPSP